MEEPILDLSKFQEIRDLEADGAPGLVDRMTSVYLAEVTETLAKLQEGLSRGDRDLIASEAHKIKSSSGSLGALRFAEVCRKIESAGRGKSAEDLGGLLASAEAEFRSFRKALADVLGNGSVGG